MILTIKAVGILLLQMALLKFITFFSLFLNANCGTQVGYENEFFPFYLKDRTSMDYFFIVYGHNRMFYAVTEIRYCAKSVTRFKLFLSNCETFYQMDDIAQRMPHAEQRSVVFIFRDSHEIKKIDRFFKEFLAYLYSKTYFVAAPIAAGPHNTVPAFGNAADLLFLNFEKKNYSYVLMLSEKPADKPPTAECKYTIAMLEELTKQLPSMKGNPIHIMLDLFYVSATDLNVIKEWSKQLDSINGILFYNIPEQLPFNIVELKKRILLLSKTVKSFVFLSEGDVRTKVFSFAPYVEWKYYEVNRKAEPTDYTDTKLEDFFRDHRAIAFFSVKECFGKLIIGGECNKYPTFLDHLLVPLRDGDKPILIDVPNKQILRLLDFSLIRVFPFLLVKLVAGPNIADTGSLMRPEDLDGKLMAFYTVAFQEMTGPVTAYTADHIAKLVEVIRKFKNNVAVRLSVEFLKEKQTPDFFGELCNLYHYKYLILMEKCCGQTYNQEQRDAIKYNLNMLCHRTTYLFVSDELRDYIYIDDDIIDPNPPTTIIPTEWTDDTDDTDIYPTLASGETRHPSWGPQPNWETIIPGVDAGHLFCPNRFLVIVVVLFKYQI